MKIPQLCKRYNPNRKVSPHYVSYLFDHHKRFSYLLLGHTIAAVAKETFGVDLVGEEENNGGKDTGDDSKVASKVHVVLSMYGIEEVY